MPTGLVVIPNFITEEEEKELLSHIPLSTSRRHSMRNTIRRYGSKTPYNSHIISEEIPSYFSFIIDRLGIKINSVTVNEYMVRQGIPFHIDSKESGPTITVLSLMSDTIMLLRKDKEREVVELPRRSLLQLSEDVRWKWEHSIPPVKEKRLSIVFRKSDI